MSPEHLDLIQRRLSGTLSEDESSALQAALKQNEELRRLFLDYSNLDVALAAKAASAEATRDLIVSPPAAPPPRWLSVRPLSAAAAGIVLGLFSASLVFGYGSQLRIKIQILLTEGFEDVTMPLERGVPRRADVWSGDLKTATSGAVKAAQGKRMVELPPIEKKKYSYAFRTIDLTKLVPMSGTETRQMEITAKFHAASVGTRDRYQIRLAAFGGDAEEAREIWVRDVVDEQSLLHVVKTVKMEPDQQGWVTVRSLIDVPSQARVLLISLAAGLPGSPKQPRPDVTHYLDEVQVRLITQDALP